MSPEVNPTLLACLETCVQACVQGCERVGDAMGKELASNILYMMGLIAQQLLDNISSLSTILFQDLSQASNGVMLKSAHG